MTRPQIELDFARTRPRVSRIGAALLAAGILGAVLVIADYRGMAAESAGLEMRLAAISPGPDAAIPDQAAMRVAEEAAAAVSELATPWSILLRERLARRLAAGVVPYLSHQAHYVGRVGVTGVALFVFGIVCFLSANSPLRQQVAALRSELAQAQQDQVTRSGSGRNLTPDAQLQAFVSGLPAQRPATAITEQIVAQATAAGLVLDRGNYPFHRDALRPDSARPDEFPAAGCLPEHSQLHRRDARGRTQCRGRRPEARTQDDRRRRSRPTSASQCSCGTKNERSKRIYAHRTRDHGGDRGPLATMALPLAELTVRRTKEQELKAALREIRTASTPTSSRPIRDGSKRRPMPPDIRLR